LIDYLEDHKLMWPSVVASMQGDRRVLNEHVVDKPEADTASIAFYEARKMAGAPNNGFSNRVHIRIM
jgi:hypothetical protein